MSKPGHHCDITIIGDIAGFTHAPNGLITGLLVCVDVGQEALIPVLPSSEVSGFRRGDRLLVRGELRSEKVAGARYGLVYLWPRHCEVLKKQKGELSACRS